MIRVVRTLPFAVAVSVCMVPSVRAAGLEDLDITIQVIEHREQGAGEIINRIELPRPSVAAELRVEAKHRQETRESRRPDVEHHADQGTDTLAIDGDIRQQSASVRESAGSDRSETRETSSDLRADSSQAVIKDVRNDIRSSVQDSSGEVKDSSGEVKDSSRDRASEVKDQLQTSAQEVRDSATDDYHDSHDD